MIGELKRIHESTDITDGTFDLLQKSACARGGAHGARDECKDFFMQRFANYFSTRACIGVLQTVVIRIDNLLGLSIDRQSVAIAQVFFHASLKRKTYCLGTTRSGTLKFAVLVSAAVAFLMYEGYSRISVSNNVEILISSGREKSSCEISIVRLVLWLNTASLT